MHLGPTNIKTSTCTRSEREWSSSNRPPFWPTHYKTIVCAGPDTIGPPKLRETTEEYDNNIMAMGAPQVQTSPAESTFQSLMNNLRCKLARADTFWRDVRIVATSIAYICFSFVAEGSACLTRDAFKQATARPSNKQFSFLSPCLSSSFKGECCRQSFHTPIFPPACFLACTFDNVLGTRSAAWTPRACLKPPQGDFHKFSRFQDGQEPNQDREPELSFRHCRVNRVVEISLQAPPSNYRGLSDTLSAKYPAKPPWKWGVSKWAFYKVSWTLAWETALADTPGHFGSEKLLQLVGRGFAKIAPNYRGNYSPKEPSSEPKIAVAPAQTITVMVTEPNWDSTTMLACYPFMA